METGHTPSNAVSTNININTNLRKSEREDSPSPFCASQASLSAATTSATREGGASAERANNARRRDLNLTLTKIAAQRPG